MRSTVPYLLQSSQKLGTRKHQLTLHWIDYPIWILTPLIESCIVDTWIVVKMTIKFLPLNPCGFSMAFMVCSDKASWLKKALLVTSSVACDKYPESLIPKYLQKLIFENKFDFKKSKKNYQPSPILVIFELRRFS